MSRTSRLCPVKRLPKRQLRGLAAGLLCLAGLFWAAGVGAGEADVLEVEVSCKPPAGDHPASICRFSVSVQHADTGWKHYANRYDVLDMEGKIVASRVLHHPHVDEQPFRRELGPIPIRHEIEKVRVRAHDLVHGRGGAEVIAEIPHSGGQPGGREPES